MKFKMPKQCFSIRVDTPRATHYLSRLDRKWQFRKICHMLSVTLTIQRPYMADIDDPTTIYGHSGKTSSHVFRDTDDPTTIYAHSGKCRCMLTVTLTIQRPYMADLGYYRKLSCHIRTCKESSCFLLCILVK